MSSSHPSPSPNDPTPFRQELDWPADTSAQGGGVREHRQAFVETTGGDLVAVSLSAGWQGRSRFCGVVLTLEQAAELRRALKGATRAAKAARRAALGREERAHPRGSVAGHPSERPAGAGWDGVPTGEELRREAARRQARLQAQGVPLDQYLREHLGRSGEEGYPEPRAPHPTQPTAQGWRPDPGRGPL